MEDNKISILKKDKTKKDKSKGVTIPPIEYYKKKIRSSPKKKINLSKKKFSQDEADSGNNIKDFLITESNVKQYKLKGNEIRKFENIYSPRTSFIIQQENEEKLLQDLGKGFDPISIKIMKSFFKERLGEINKEEFIGLLQNNL